MPNNPTTTLKLLDDISLDILLTIFDICDFKSLCLLWLTSVNFKKYISQYLLFGKITDNSLTDNINMQRIFDFSYLSEDINQLIKKLDLWLPYQNLFFKKLSSQAEKKYQIKDILLITTPGNHITIDMFIERLCNYKRVTFALPTQQKRIATNDATYVTCHDKIRKLQEIFQRVGILLCLGVLSYACITSLSHTSNTKLQTEVLLYGSATFFSSLFLIYVFKKLHWFFVHMPKKNLHLKNIRQSPGFTINAQITEILRRNCFVNQSPSMSSTANLHQPLLSII